MTDRRHFFKTAAAGAVLGPSSLLFAQQAEGRAHPNLVNGEVLRTSGTISGDPNWFGEAAREIPVAGRTQVIVCGGGPAGIGAALARLARGRTPARETECRR